METSIIDFTSPFLPGEVSARKIEFDHQHPDKYWWNEPNNWGSVILDENPNPQLWVRVDTQGLKPGKYEGELHFKQGRIYKNIRVKFEVSRILSFDKDKVNLGHVYQGDSLADKLVINKVGQGPGALKISYDKNPFFSATCYPNDVLSYPKTVEFQLNTKVGSKLIDTGKQIFVLTVSGDGITYEIPVKATVLAAEPLSVDLPQRCDCGCLRVGQTATASFDISLDGRPLESIHINWEDYIPNWAGPIRYTSSLFLNPFPMTVEFDIQAIQVGTYNHQILVSIADLYGKEKEIQLPVSFEVKPRSWFGR